MKLTPGYHDRLMFGAFFRAAEADLAARGACELGASSNPTPRVPQLWEVKPKDPWKESLTRPVYSDPAGRLMINPVQLFLKKKKTNTGASKKTFLDLSLSRPINLRKVVSCLKILPFGDNFIPRNQLSSFAGGYQLAAVV